MQVTPDGFEMKWMTARAGPACIYRRVDLPYTKLDQIVVVGGEIWDGKRSAIATTAVLLCLDENIPSEKMKNAFYKQVYSELRKGPVEERNHSMSPLKPS